jgi:inner membrane protein
MDSLSQLVLGASISVAVMGRRTAVWKAALWGGICGTLPDLDVVIRYGDAVRDMTYHRAESHAFFYLTLVAPLLAGIASKLHGETTLFKRWFMALWLALVTHPILDTTTIYGTQLLLPFSDHPYGTGSMFIIDPLYTLPLLVGVIVVLSRKAFAGLPWNTAGLIISTAYLGWSMIAQAHVRGLVNEALAEQGIASQSILVTPAPLNTILWRVVVMRPDGLYEGYYSLLDGGRKVKFERFASDAQLYAATKNFWTVQRMAWFTHGFFKMQEKDSKAILTDLRMGSEPHYVFSFELAQKKDGVWQEIRPQQVGSLGDPVAQLSKLWQRMLGRDIPTSR